MPCRSVLLAVLQPNLPRPHLLHPSLSAVCHTGRPTRSVLKVRVTVRTLTWAQCPHCPSHAGYVSVGGASAVHGKNHQFTARIINMQLTLQRRRHVVLAMRCPSTSTYQTEQTHHCSAPALSMQCCAVRVVEVLLGSLQPVRGVQAGGVVRF